MSLSLLEMYLVKILYIIVGYIFNWTERGGRDSLANNPSLHFCTMSNLLSMFKSFDKLHFRIQPANLIQGLHGSINNVKKKIQLFHSTTNSVSFVLSSVNCLMKINFRGDCVTTYNSGDGHPLWCTVYVGFAQTQGAFLTSLFQPRLKNGRSILLFQGSKLEASGTVPMTFTFKSTDLFHMIQISSRLLSTLQWTS